MSSANPTHRTSAPATLEVYSLGAVEFRSLLGLQDRLVYETSGRNDLRGTLLLCEHPPVVSVGREGGYEQFRVPPETFASQLMEVHRVPRGGGSLVHVPGQLAAYLLLPLDRLELGPVAFRSRLARALCATCREFHVAARENDQFPGAWARTGQVGYVAAAIKSNVSCFGVYLNVSPALPIVRQCAPSGITHRQSSLTADRLRATSMAAARECLARHLAAEFEYDQHHWYTGHPLLVRTKKPIYVHA